MWLDVQLDILDNSSYPLSVTLVTRNGVQGIHSYWLPKDSGAEVFPEEGRSDLSHPLTSQAGLSGMNNGVDRSLLQVGPRRNYPPLLPGADSRIRLANSVRDLIPSFRNTLCR
jgi:hypothetical protein